MAPQFELIDPIGRNYDLQQGSADYRNGLSAQVFDGRQPLWERGATQNGFDLRASYYQFDGSSAADRRFERVNDYRDRQSFDNPYTHLQNAHQLASRNGAHASMREYYAAISAADRIDQGQVSRDLNSNHRALMMNEQRMMRAERSGASYQQMQALDDQRVMLERRQEFLHNMRMAPVYARANAAFCFIARGNNQLSSAGETLLRQAVEMNPSLEGDYYFNAHRQRAYMERNRRLAEERRRFESQNQTRGPLQRNPYEPDVPPVYDPNRRPEQQRFPVTPQRPPEQRPPEQRPPEQRPPVVPQRPPEQTTPVVPQRPPEQTTPVVPQRPPEQATPAERPPVPNSPVSTENRQPPQRFDLSLLAPSGDLYSPAGPPGLGESTPGEAFTSEKDGKGGWDIDWRELSSKNTDSQGVTTYKYKGEIDDSNGWILGLDGDTNFTAEETIGSGGQLLKRVLTYDGSLNYKVKTDAGPRELENVHKITTTYNERAKRFDTEIECSTGAIYKAETDLSGKVIKFTEVQTKPASEAPGLTQANVDKFKNSADVYHVARPVGIGGAIPGWAGDDNDVLDWRETQITRASGNVTYKYKGEVEDSSGWVLGMNGDTNFEAQEILDANNNLVSSFIKYESAKDMKFIGVGGQVFSVSDVVKVNTIREGDGSYTSTVTDKKGATRTIKFKSDGTVTEAK